MHKLHQRSSHSAPYKPYGVGTQKYFFGSKSEKKNQKIHDFRPKKRGGHFFDIFDPPPPTPTPPPKKWVSSGGGLGGSGPKTHWGMCLLDKIMILQGVELTIQPLGVGYANRPKKGGMWRFPLYTPAWL